MKTIQASVIGNGAVKNPNNILIKTSEIVVRFNKPPSEHLKNYPKTDILVISNSSKQSSKLLNTRDYIESPPFRDALKLVFPYSQEVIQRYMPKPNLFSKIRGRRADLTNQCIRAAMSTNKEHEILSTQIYHDVCNKLNIETSHLRSIFPSSGIMAIQGLLDKFGLNIQVHAFGFGFQGWKHHKWPAERQYMHELATNGVIILHE